jgi:outer membrane protein TolC
LSYLPDVSLATNYTGLGGGINGLPDHLWTIGFLITWQPFEWGKRRHEIAEKSDAVQQANLALREAQAGAQLDVDNRIRQERQAREQQRAAQAAQAAARERLRVTLNQYQVKAALLKDVLQAQAALTDADRQARDADLAALTAQSELRRALGEE